MGEGWGLQKACVKCNREAQVNTFTQLIFTFYSTLFFTVQQSKQINCEVFISNNLDGFLYSTQLFTVNNDAL